MLLDFKVSLLRRTSVIDVGDGSVKKNNIATPMGKKMFTIFELFIDIEILRQLK